MFDGKKLDAMVLLGRLFVIFILAQCSFLQSEPSEKTLEWHLLIFVFKCYPACLQITSLSNSMQFERVEMQMKSWLNYNSQLIS
jgi:hypothetical protein